MAKRTEKLTEAAPADGICPTRPSTAMRLLMERHLMMLTSAYTYVDASQAADMPATCLRSGGRVTAPRATFDFLNCSGVLVASLFKDGL